ncbi:MAG TPA: serine/threonine-protein kinase [Steroidobacteraceae bacterium]|nr:serine/threonine-protein kinase [Steroidobacteraceae bacterium]
MPEIKDWWGEVSPLLDEAMELPLAARESWLADLERRAPQLAAHVRSCLREVSELSDRKFLDDSIRRHLPAGLEGQTFGAYTLDRILGFGGMGTVWLAHRSDGRFEGQVAVKLLNLAFVGHPSEQRFTREGSVLARLQHPHIARLLDAGLEQDRQPYLVLEYVRGERIDTYCDQRGLNIEQRIGLFLDVLAAVAHAHSNLVVHRDLKPSNIFVTEQGAVKLLDFGIAALLSREGDDVTPLTGHIGPGLTPGYAAPEQLLGRPITTATDVYALGIVLFELLAGRRPASAGDEPKAAAQWIQRTLESDAPRLSDVALREDWRRGLRGDLDNIVALALRRNAEERYRTAELFAQDLRHFLAHEPVSARPRSVGYLAAKFVRRNRAAVASACVMVIALIAAGGFSVWQMLQANQQRRLAEDQASRAEFARDFAEFVLTDAGTTGKPFTTSELLLRAEQAIPLQYGSADNPAAVEQLIKLGMLFARVGQYRKARELFEQANARALAGNYAELRWQSACELGRLQHYAGRLQQGAALLDAAIAQLQRSAPDSPALIECFEQKSDLELTRQDVPLAIATAQASLAQAQRLFPRAPLHWISPRVQLGTSLRAQGRFQAADDMHRGTLDLLRRLGRERTANAVLLYNSWGIVRSDIGDIAGAAKLFESALAVGQSLWVGAAPDQWVSVTYGRRLVLLNRLDEAEQHFASALRQSGGEEDAEMQIGALLGMLSVNRERGNFEAARAAREQAEQFVAAHLPPEHNQRQNLVFESGLLDLAANSLDDARAQLQQVVTQFKSANRRQTDQIVALAALAQCALQTHEPGRAAELAAEASALARKVAVPGQPSYWLGLALLAQVDVEQAVGNADRAQQLSGEALAQLSPTVGTDHPLTKKAAALAKL